MFVPQGNFLDGDVNVEQNLRQGTSTLERVTLRKTLYSHPTSDNQP